MKTITTCLVVFASMLSIGTAEIPNRMIHAFQKKAPEKLEIEVIKVSTKKSISGNYHKLQFEVTAKVIEVEITHTGLKAGDRLLIEYEKYDDDKPVPTGSYPISVKEGMTYKVYLGSVKSDKKPVTEKNPIVYSPRAARGSFVVLPIQKSEAKK